MVYLEGNAETLEVAAGYLKTIRTKAALPLAVKNNCADMAGHMEKAARQDRTTAAELKVLSKSSPKSR